jgi:hypothetical protein
MSRRWTRDIFPPTCSDPLPRILPIPDPTNCAARPLHSHAMQSATKAQLHWALLSRQGARRIRSHDRDRHGFTRAHRGTGRLRLRTRATQSARQCSTRGSHRLIAKRRERGSLARVSHALGHVVLIEHDTHYRNQRCFRSAVTGCRLAIARGIANQRQPTTTSLIWSTGARSV